MNSWDLYDTLVGRWYEDPRSIFSEVEKRSEYVGFAKIRRDAELELYPTSPNVTFDQIYDNFQRKTGISDERKQELKDCELELELMMTFPIKKNASRVQKGDIIVSDMYLSKEFIKEVVAKNGITPVSNIYVMSGGKQTGRIWNEVLKGIRPEIHTGDNVQSDCEGPRKHGIRTSCYRDVRSKGEEELLSGGFDRIANLARVLRLSFPLTRSNERLVWEEQATINIPILILLSLYIPLIFKGKRALMSTRDCNNLLRIFPLITPEIKAEEFYTSRKCYWSNSQSYEEYARHMLGIDDPLIIDLHGSGNSPDHFFLRFGKKPNSFTVVQTRQLGDPPKLWRKYIIDRTFTEMFAQKDGIMWDIENTNLDEVGSVMDVRDGKPIRAPLRYRTEMVKVQHAAVSEAVRLLEQGFDIRPTTVSEEGIRTTITGLLKILGRDGAAVLKCGIPDINDWPGSTLLQDLR
jgi:FMN phosphatase YigB (HAD superfamily)